MNERVAVFLCQLISMGTCLVVHIPVKHHFRTVALRPVHLHERCRRRHNDDRLGSKPGCCIGNALGVIACGSGDQSFLPFFLREGTDLIVGAPHLVSAGELHVLRLQINLCSCLAAQIFAVHQLRLQRDVFDDLRSLLKFFQCQHFLSPLCCALPFLILADHDRGCLHIRLFGLAVAFILLPSPAPGRFCRTGH